MKSRLLLWAVLLGLPGLSFAANLEHRDPIAPIILGVTSLFFFAIIGRYIAKRFHQPGVLGELLMGILLGNICYYISMPLMIVLREGSAIFTIMRELLGGVGLHQAVANTLHNPKTIAEVTAALSGGKGMDILKTAYVADIFARYGVIFLLFMVGLESSVEELRHTGRAALSVAVVGVVAPIILGFITAHLLLPQSSYQEDLFVAAALCATSIGISASVLAEMKFLKSREARTILGAAMIDDVLGLVILAVVTSIAISGVVDLLLIVWIVCLCVAFFLGVIFLGPWVIRQAVAFFQFLSLWEAKLFIAFLFVMVLAYLATVAHLASIIGAFAAGLIIHDGYFYDHKKYHANSLRIKHLIAPLESILAPLFFTLVGIQVKLEAFFDWHVVVLSLGLLVAAVIGKLLSGLGAPARDDRLFIGIGMLPRGEVGLVFASIGRSLNVMSDSLFAAIILMVIITTLVAPPLLKLRFTKCHAVRP